MLGPVQYAYAVAAIYFYSERFLPDDLAKLAVRRKAGGIIKRLQFGLPA